MTGGSAGPAVLASAAISGSGGRVGGWKRVVWAVAMVVSATACGAGVGESEPVATETPTTTTRTPRVVDDSGRPQITFDPCLDIPDELLLEAGYDPRSEEIADYPMGSYTFLVCSYNGTVRIPGTMRPYGLNILSGNVTLEEELLKDGAISAEIDVNGRRALLEVDPDAKNLCAIAVETNFGIVIVSRLYNPDHTRGSSPEEWCAGLRDLAQAIEVQIID